VQLLPSLLPLFSPALAIESKGRAGSSSMGSSLALAAKVRSAAPVIGWNNRRRSTEIKDDVERKSDNRRRRSSLRHTTTGAHEFLINCPCTEALGKYKRESPRGCTSFCREFGEGSDQGRHSAVLVVAQTKPRIGPKTKEVSVTSHRPFAWEQNL